MTRVTGSPSGAEKITADPFYTEPVDRPQARPALVVLILVKHKPGSRFTMKSTETRICGELMRTAEGRDRVDKDEEKARREGPCRNGPW